MTLFAIGMGPPSTAPSPFPDLDPDLAEATKYDGEMNGGDVKISSQSLAEKFYLKYLEHCADSQQRTRVYTQLGVLFNTGYQPDRGEKPDYKKAKIYFAEALKAEPERFGFATIRARYGMISPEMAPDEIFAKRVENFKWLEAAGPTLAADRWLLGEVFRDPRDGDVKTTLNYIDGLRDAEINNLLSMAGDASITSTKRLKQIVGELPGTKLAAAARARLSEIDAKSAARQEAK